ncbi:MAG: hypothetical protein Q7T21_09640 [Gallionella sp.]|nr:hypothetical protein [Gallionella sp.]
MSAGALRQQPTNTSRKKFLDDVSRMTPLEVSVFPDFPVGNPAKNQLRWAGLN